MNKQIIERKLPLNVKYVCTDKKYISLINGIGCTCDNCGKLIANIATVKSINGTYNIGFDCLETFLLNNNLLEGFNVEEYEKVKKMIPKILRFAKSLKETIELNNGLDGFKFERPTGYFAGDGYITYWLLKGNQKPYNTNVKIKEMDFDFLITTLKSIFSKHTIIVS